jgi:hypothetical protein
LGGGVPFRSCPVGLVMLIKGGLNRGYAGWAVLRQEGAQVDWAELVDVTLA